MPHIHVAKQDKQKQAPDKDVRLSVLTGFQLLQTGPWLDYPVEKDQLCRQVDTDHIDREQQSGAQRVIILSDTQHHAKCCCRRQQSN